MYYNMILNENIKNKVIDILTGLGCSGDDGEPAYIRCVYFDGDVCKFNMMQEDGCEYHDLVFTAMFPVNAKEDYLIDLDLTDDEYDFIYDVLYNDSALREAVYIDNIEALNEAAETKTQFFNRLSDKLGVPAIDIEKKRYEYFIDILYKIFGTEKLNDKGNGVIGVIDITPNKLEKTYNLIAKFDRSYWNGMTALENLGITSPIEFAEFVTSPVIYKNLTKVWSAEFPGAEIYIKARKDKEAEETKRRRGEAAGVRFIEKINLYASVALELFDYKLGVSKTEDLKFAKSIMDLGEEAYKEMFVVRSRYYDNIPCVFVEFKPNIKEILDLEEGSADVLNSAYIPQYGENARLQANVSTLLDYLYLHILLTEVYVNLKDLLADCDEGFNPRWIPAPCYIGHFVESPVPSKNEEKEVEKRANGEEDDDIKDLGLAESVDNDRAILKQLVESYGKKDVLNYINHLNESANPSKIDYYIKNLH